MRLLFPVALLFVVLPEPAAVAQVSQGAIAGTVRDATGAGVPRATVRTVCQDTGRAREVVSSDRGDYSVLALTSGSYVVTAEASGFRAAQLLVRVLVGTTSAADLTLPVEGVSASVSVSAATALARDRYQVAGVITRAQIDSLPLNGRSFLELAKLEPGVTSPVRGTNNRMFVNSLGSGHQTIPRIGNTRVTMDGGSVATIGGIGTVLQVSQDAIDEFQLATVNLDVASGPTTNGAVSVVTRAGANTVRATGFLFYRDDTLAAHPGLVKDVTNPDPFFRRVQGGVSVGAPLYRDRAFAFASYERNNQDGVVAVWPSAPEFLALGGIFPSPFRGNLFTVRVDVQPRTRHHVLLRHSHDDNDAFAPPGSAMPLLPSAWSRIANRVDQSLAGLTSLLSDHAASDVRFSVLSMRTDESPPESKDCAGCFGLGSARSSVQGAGLTFGRNRQGWQDGWRAQLTADVSWQSGRHQLRAGTNWEHSEYTTATISSEPAQLVLWSPLQTRIRNPSMPLPASFETPADILQLPLRSFQAGVGSDANLQRGFRDVRVLDSLRLYAAHAWRLAPRWTVNAGLAWLYEPNVLNHDLTKPDLLIPILGRNGLRPPAARPIGPSPAAGLTWMATSDGKTLVRGGAGHYTDGLSWANSVHLFNERRYLMPLGGGRFVVSGSNVQLGGRTLDFRQPTAFSGQQLLDVLPQVRAGLEAGLPPGNRDFSLRNLNRSKEGANLSDPRYGVPTAIHAGAGVERALSFDIIVSADVVYRRFMHTFVNGIDYNRFYSAAGPVIPACTPAQRADDGAPCSNGPLYFDTTAGRARYRGLLLRLNKRLAAGTQLLAAYAFGSWRGTNGSAVGTVEPTGGRATGFNNDDWFENDGPLATDVRHVLSISGTVGAPAGLDVAFSINAASRPPFSAYVSGLDFNHDGTADDLLPGSRVNQFGSSLNKDDLGRLVAAYNRDYANRVFAVGGTPVAAPEVALPQAYDFNDSFLTVDARLGRTIELGSGSRLFLFAEVFNLFNTANLIGYGGDLSNPTTFGQPGASVSQVFGSGGPRAAQIGARLRF